MMPWRWRIRFCFSTMSLMTSMDDIPMQGSNTTLDRSQCGEIAAECACFNFRKASRAVTQMYDSILSPSGMRSTQFTVLIGLALKDKITVTELADMLAIDRTTLTRSFKPLLRRAMWVSWPRLTNACGPCGC